MTYLDKLTERRNEALADRAEPVTPLERAVVHYEDEAAAAELAALRAQVEYVISELGVGDNNRPVEALVRDVKTERDALRAAKEQSDKLLRNALDLFHGTLELCDDVYSEEWIWKWRVRYYFEDTDIPVHPLPADMKAGQA